MLITSLSNINVAIKKNSLVVFEKYSLQLIKLLNLLWKKKLIIGYIIINDKIKILLKYNRSSPLIKEFKIVSKPSNKRFKKIKDKFSLYILSNSKLGLCITSTLSRHTLYGTILFKIII